MLQVLVKYNCPSNSSSHLAREVLLSYLVAVTLFTEDSTYFLIFPGSLGVMQGQ